MPPLPTKSPFPDSYLLRYSDEHIFYEVDHFLWLADLLTKRAEINGPEGIWRLPNILIEGFAVHLRNLIDFLYPTVKIDTDILAEQFLLPDEWEKIRPQISAVLKDARQRAHKEVAHLTSSRMDGSPPEKEWDFDGLVKEIKPLLKLFASNAVATRLGSKVKSLITS